MILCILENSCNDMSYSLFHYTHEVHVWHNISIYIVSLKHWRKWYLLIKYYPLIWYYILAAWFAVPWHCYYINQCFVNIRNLYWTKNRGRLLPCLINVGLSILSNIDINIVVYSHRCGMLSLSRLIIYYYLKNSCVFISDLVRCDDNNK